jgi:hypothetical protein
VDRYGAEWANSGAMALTGRSDGPALGAPAALIDLVERAEGILRHGDGGLATLDGMALLGERAAIDGLTRQGVTSCGGSTRLIPVSDGWLAISLARDEDTAALPAWLQCEIPAADPWPAVTEAVAGRRAAPLDRRAALLGLPIAALASVAPPGDGAFGLPISAAPFGAVAPHPGAGAVVVVDLSSLWAGPLCGQLLAQGGADVIKVESVGRPDGARRGPSRFFDLLNGTKRSVALDLGTSGGLRDLRRILAAADVVIESARPRALEQLGIDAAEILHHGPRPRIWVSVTSHGRGQGDRERVAFGDVASVAGGLIARDRHGPCFLADAVTDPLSGLIAAAAVHQALASGGRWMLDVAMAPLAASVAGELLDVRAVDARPPRARPVTRAASPLGIDTATVVAEVDP